MKFDCIIMNPPYKRNLHLKILDEAIKHLNETIAVLRSRTNKRVARGVEGTSTI